MNLRFLARSEYLMRVTTLTTCNENMREAKTGDHKGRPYDGIVGVYFRSNDRVPVPIVATNPFCLPLSARRGG